MCFRKNHRLEQENQNLRDRIWELEQDYDRAVKGLMVRNEIVRNLRADNAEKDLRLSKFDHRNRKRGDGGKFVKSE